MPHPRVHLESNTAQDLINHNKKVSLIIKTIKAGFHRYHRYDCCNRWKERSAIVVITWVPHFSDRSAHIISQRSLKSGFYMVATIFSDHRDRNNRTETSLYFQYFSVVYPCIYPRSRCSFALMPLISNTPNCVHDSSFWFTYSFM